jgi:hypothetical protein
MFTAEWLRVVLSLVTARYPQKTSFPRVVTDGSRSFGGIIVDGKETEVSVKVYGTQLEPVGNANCPLRAPRTCRRPLSAR